MRIIRSQKYLRNLDNLLEYIASRDSVTKSIRFLNKLDKAVSSLSYMSYRYRKSYYYDDENIRDLVFMGYTIPYLIDIDKIVILDIFKWSDR